MPIIGVCGRKGGSGKTTTAVHLAAELASRGLSAVVIDCDIQGSATHWAEPGNLPVPVHHMPLEADSQVAEWSKSVRAIQAQYIILDSPPHLDAALGGVIGLADVAVIPCGPSGLDLIATGETVGLVREIRNARGNGRPLVLLVPNRIDRRTSSGRELKDALADMGEPVAPEIHYRTAFADAFNTGAWVGAYAPHKPCPQGNGHAGRVRAETTGATSMTVQKPGLRARSSSVQAALTAQSTGEKAVEMPPAPPPPLPTVKEKAKPVGLSVRLDHDTHEALRRIAFDERVSIHSLLMEGVDLVLKKRLKA